MRRSRVCSCKNVFLIAATLVLLLPATSVFGTEESASNLTLYRTAIKSRTDEMTLSTTYVAGFTATTVTCPSTATNGCTLKVEVASQDTDFYDGDYVIVNLTITGSGDPVDPASIVQIDSVPTGSPYSPTMTNSFTWMKRGVTKGSSQTVNVDFANPGGNDAYISNRTLTIDVYTN